jgi:sulfofructose kinase
MTFPPRLPAQRAFDVVGLGANACDHLLIVPHHPAPGEKVRFRDMLRQGGGQTATALVTVARLGHSARYLGGVGDDEAGAHSLAELRAEGIETEGVRVRPGGLSQQAYILVDEATGERTIVWGRSEGMIVAPHELQREQIVAGRMLHTDAQQPRSAVQAARWAHEADMPVLADLEPVRPGLEEFLPEVDILIAAEEFPEPATGAAELGEALRRLEERTRGGLIMVTRGAAGVVARIDGDLRTYPAYAVEAVDTTGAGDVFHGAFAVACLRGFALEEAIDFSHAVAAMKCLALGGRTGIPRSMEDVERFRRVTPRRRVGGGC